MYVLTRLVKSSFAHNFTEIGPMQNSVVSGSLSYYITRPAICEAYYYYYNYYYYSTTTTTTTITVLLSLVVKTKIIVARYLVRYDNWMLVIVN